MLCSFLQFILPCTKNKQSVGWHHQHWALLVTVIDQRPLMTLPDFLLLLTYLCSMFLETKIYNMAMIPENLWGKLYVYFDPQKAIPQTNRIKRQPISESIFKPHI